MINNQAPWWIAVTFLIYIIVWDCSVLYISWYTVFVLHYSPYWLFAGLVLLMASFKTDDWYRLFKPKA